MGWDRMFRGFYLCLALLVCAVALYKAQSDQESANAKIFQIGMNKCGTRTLAKFFEANGIPSVHCEDGKLADSIFARYESGQELIGPEYDGIVFFSDMESTRRARPVYIAEELFRELYQQYPDAKFILNTRDKQAWIKSRLSHVNKKYNSSYIENLMQAYNMTREEVIAKWSHDWDEQHRAVQEFFADKPGQLLVFNIDTDGAEKLVEFFGPYYTLDAKYYVHVGKTKTTNVAS